MLSFRRVAFVLLFYLTVPVVSEAQAQPTGLSVAPGTIYRAPGSPSCYTIYVSGGANMLVDIRYKFANSTDRFIYGWPQLDAFGQAYICTDNLTQVGQYTFTGVRNTLNGSSPFVNVAANLSVLDTPSQATGLTFNGGNSSQGYAGINSYTLHAANTSMSVVVEYTINCTVSCPVYQNTIGLNAYGDFTHALLHEQMPGIYRYSQIRNQHRSDWIAVNATYTVLPPKPTSLSITPASVVAGNGSYVMTVGNGKNVYLDARYTFTPPGGSAGAPTAIPFPFWLGPANAVDSTGHVAVYPGACDTPTGTYAYTWINNRDLSLPPYYDGSGLQVNTAITIAPPGPPTFSYADPMIGLVGGTNIDVTITGSNFCGASLSTTYIGLNVNAAPPVVWAPNTLKAKFSIASNAPVGNAAIVIATPRGTASFSFAIASPAPPAVTSVSPASAGVGSATRVTMNGTNLTGSQLSTSYTGLSFSSITTTSTTLSATFNVSQNAVPGAAEIIVATLGGTTNVPFTITAGQGGNTGPGTTKEYVYLGHRLIAVETWSASTQPPGPPQQLTAESLNQTTVQLRWYAATAVKNTHITAYQLKRGDTVIATLPASQFSYLDTTASPGASYTFNAVAKDNTIPIPLVSANSNSASVTMAQETIPPTAPANIGLGCEPYEDYFLCYAEWTPSTDSGGSGLRGYLVDIDEYGQRVRVTSTAIAENSYWFLVAELRGLWVYAIDNAGNISAPGTWAP
jgi:hypothetical protein